MKKHFCTISTYSHLFKCFALADSIAPFNGFLNILLVDKNFVEYKNTPKNVKFYYLNELQTSVAKKIKTKYAKESDKLRWSLKSVFLLHLLNDYKKIIYADNDIFFYNDYSFLFDSLDKHCILLSPHHYNRDPRQNQNWLEANFRVGLYNAGFVATNQSAKSTLEWWALACLYRCEKNYWRGLFDDQKYLDLFPIIETNTKVLSHKGCNVAAWNQGISVRSYKDGKHLINDSELLIFYHFNDFSLKLIDEKDLIFQEYIRFLAKYKDDLSVMFHENKLHFIDRVKIFIWNILNKMNK